MTGANRSGVSIVLVINEIMCLFGVSFESLVVSDPVKLVYICAFCQETFIPGSKKAKFCSDMCRNKQFRKQY